MPIDFLLNVFKKSLQKEAIIWKDQSFSYQWLLDRIDHWRGCIREWEVASGTVVVIEGDFSPNSIALFLALTERLCILVPLTRSTEHKNPEFIQVVQGEVLIVIDENDQTHVKKLPNQADHEYYRRLKELKHPGLIHFSSGSTGKHKAAVHDFKYILEKFEVPRHAFRSITFLLYDHLGGVNTMLYNLSNAGCIITVLNRTPDEVLSMVEKYKVTLLPTSPTFINLIIFSEAYKKYDLSSLKTVTYGTEPMPESTLKKFHGIFPDINLLQTYGLSELGVLRSKSKSSDSLLVKVGGEGFKTRVVDGILQIKSKSAMLGYLNAPSPFTEDGWFNTDDAVEVDGEYMRFLGRQSEIINVGGGKVYPAEVESVIQEIDNVAEITVYGEKNPIIGNIVCAKVTLNDEENKKEFTSRLKKYCSERLENFKVPVKVKIVEEKQYTDRFKKIRSV